MPKSTIYYHRTGIIGIRMGGQLNHHSKMGSRGSMAYCEKQPPKPSSGRKYMNSRFCYSIGGKSLLLLSPIEGLAISTQIMSSIA